MPLPERALVFLDASVLVAAAHSLAGGSAVALQVCQGAKFRAAVTAQVLLEARVNIAEKFDREELLRFYRQVADLRPQMVGAPTEESLAACSGLTAMKDVHVLAAALECKAAFLLSLDRRHLLTVKVRNAGLPFSAMTPGEFLKLLVK